MNIQKFSEEKYSEVLTLHRDLCLIPAPSHFEEKRAEYILKYLKDAGVDNAHIDDAKNVVCTLGKPSDKMILFVAHSDTVFPMDTPLNYIDDGEKIHCPGAGDDTASLAGLITCVKYLSQNNIVPEKTLMFAANSCEEGLGNLKGIRKIFEDYGDRIEYMYTFDSGPKKVVCKSVGSHRYKITAITEGGHSFGNFGNRNAIAVISEIINEIYKIEVPKIENSVTTYNVGVIEGGTSINTIAQNASMLCEYRSDSEQSLEIMKNKFADIFDKAKEKCTELKVELVGDRPCMSSKIDAKKHRNLIDRAKDIQGRNFGVEVKECSGSTDCNIPHSLGIPAVSVANFSGGGTHTREEWIYKESLKTGLMTCMEFILTEGELL